MSLPEVKSHEQASCFPARLTSAARPALRPSQRYSTRFVATGSISVSVPSRFC
jgi:hypothetical protein